MAELAELAPSQPAQPIADLQGIVDGMVGLDETSIVTVINSVLQARPETAPSVVSFAVPDLTYPPQRALVERRSNGWIKSYAEEKGYGFITCDEIKQVFGNDVFLHAPQAPPGVHAGMPVNFAIVLNDSGKPQAYDLQPPGKGKGKGKGGKDDGKGWKGGGGMMDFMGGKDDGKGWKGGGGMMDFIAAMMKGDWSKGGWGDDWGKGKGNKGKGKDKGPTPGRPVDGMETIGDQFVGTIKSFSAQKGWGFIECADLKAQYGHDVFLHHAQLGEFEVGSTVQFAAFLNQQGNPQAKDLRDMGTAPKRAKTEGAAIEAAAEQALS